MIGKQSTIIEKLKAKRFTIVVHLVSWIVTFIWIIPFLGVFMSSIRPFKEVQYGWWNLYLSPPSQGFLYHFLLSSIAGLIVSTVYVAMRRIKHVKFKLKEILISATIFLVTWIAYAYASWYFVFAGELHIQNFNPTLESFFDVWAGKTSRAPLSVSIVNSLIVTIPATFIPILVASLAAYSFARFSFRTKDLLFLAIVLLQTIPQQMVILPIFNLMNNLHLLNTYIGLILLHTAFGLPWQILFLRNFFSTLPVEIEEAARVDGASYFKIFYRIILPMSLPALASIISLQFVWVWNDFFFALTMVQNPNMRLVTQTIPANFTRYEPNWSLLSAASIIAMILPIAIYIALQRYYVRGLTAGAVKG